MHAIYRLAEKSLISKAIIPLCSFLLPFSAFGKVWPLSDTWAPIGDVILGETLGDGDHGDGANDGSIFVDGQSAAVGQGAQYTFHGTLENGESLSVTTTIHNVNVSFVSCRIELLNLTDGTILDSETHSLAANTGTQTVTLSATAGSGDVGDSLALRYIRTDDGNTARNFAIDNAIMDGWFFPRSSANRRTPDLSILPDDPIFQGEIDSIVEGWYQRTMPTPPTTADLNAAIAQYDSLGISYSGGLPTGNLTSWTSVSFLDTFAKELYHNPTNQDLIDRANLCVQAFAQRLYEGQIPADFAGYSNRHFLRDAVLLKGVLNQISIDYLTYIFDLGFEHFDYFWAPNFPFNASGLPEPGVNTDLIFNMSDTVMLFCLGFQTSNQETQRWARGFKRYCERFCTPAPGTADGIKIDGSGFHHWTDYPIYMYAYRTFVDVISALGNTQVQIGVDQYKTFRNALTSLFVRSRERVQPIAMSGRRPEFRLIQPTQESLRDLALAGGKILGTGNSDPSLAEFYNAIYGLDPALGVTSVDDLSGSFQLNYTSSLAQRGNGWTAVMKGFTNYFWGSEIYTSNNRYGRYQSYGTLEVLYKGGLAGNGISLDGWDWNHPEGATTVILPYPTLHGERSRIDEYQDERFAGGGTLSNQGKELLGHVRGNFGIFGMIFDEKSPQGFGTTFGPNTHNDSFQFRKSAFTFGDVIVALASGISNNDSLHPTATTLFQKSTTSGVTVKTSEGNFTTPGNRTLASGNQRWILGPFQTGFVAGGANDTIQLDWGTQLAPPTSLNDPNDTASYRSGEFAKAYLDHGSSPSNKGYEYAVLPKTTESQLQNFSTRMQGTDDQKPYRVVAKNNNHHIIRYQDSTNPVWGLALFEASSSLPSETTILANDRPALVMYEEQSPSKMLLSVTDPDLGLSGPRTYNPAISSTVNIDLKGDWKLETISSQVTASPLNGGADTRLTFSLQDGLPEEISLTTRLDYNSWAQIFFSPAEMADSSISGQLADPDGDCLDNLIEFVLGTNPTTADTSPAPIFIENSNQGRFHFLFDGSTSGVTTTIQTSSDLISWTDTHQSTDGAFFSTITPGYTLTDGGTPREISISSDANPGKLFYRIKVVENP